MQSETKLGAGAARANRIRAAAAARKNNALITARASQRRMKAAEKVLADAQIARAQAACSAYDAGASLREIGDAFDGIERQTAHALIARGREGMA